MLTLQWPLVHLVIQNCFDILYALLHFTNTFPKTSVALQFVKHALLHSALKHMPGAGHIYQQLMHNEEYLWKIILLVSHLSHTFITIANHIHSHVLGFPFTDIRSKSIAVPLLGHLCWQLMTHLKSQRLLRSNSSLKLFYVHVRTVSYCMYGVLLPISDPLRLVLTSVNLLAPPFSVSDMGIWD
jgi:hypothetical protein